MWYDPLNSKTPPLACFARQTTPVSPASISQDPEFFRFLRQLEAYESAVGKGTRLILSTDNEFLQLLNGSDIPDQ